MITLNIHLFNNTKYNPQFKASYPKNLIVNDIRDIPGLTCASCGGKMLSRPEFKEFLMKFLVGAVAALKSPIFDRIRETRAFETISEVAKKHPRTPLAVLRDTNSEFTKDINLTDTLDFVIQESGKMCKKAPQAINLLKRIKDKLPEERQAELDYMEVLASIYPNKTFRGIFTTPEVKELLEKTYKYENLVLENRTEEFLNRIAKITKDSEYAPKILDKITDASWLAILDSDFPLKTRKKIINYKFYKLYKQINDKILVEKLKKEVQKMPYRENSPQASLSKYCEGYDDLDIISDFVGEIKSTWEHIIPNSKGGSNNMENGLCMHRHCNNARANIPYWVINRQDINFVANIQTQMNRIMGYINHGNLVDNDRLPQVVKQTLLRISNGEIRLNISKFLKRQIAKKAEDVQRNKELLDEQKSIIAAINSDMANRSAEIDKLYAEIERLRKQINMLKGLNGSRKQLEILAAAQIDSTRRDLESAQVQLETLKRDLGNDKLQ